MPFNDFEDNVMLQIENTVLHQKDLKKELKLSWIFSWLVLYVESLFHFLSSNYMNRSWEFNRRI